MIEDVLQNTPRFRYPDSPQSPFEYHRENGVENISEVNQQQVQHDGKLLYLLSKNLLLYFLYEKKIVSIALIPTEWVGI